MEPQSAALHYPETDDDDAKAVTVDSASDSQGTRESDRDCQGHLPAAQLQRLLQVGHRRQEEAEADLLLPDPLLPGAHPDRSRAGDSRGVGAGQTRQDSGWRSKGDQMTHMNDYHLYNGDPVPAQWLKLHGKIICTI